MKTPREILFARHKAVEPKLDERRQKFLEQLGHPAARHETRAKESTPLLLKLWMELILPARGIWLGLAAVWVAILVVSFGEGEPRQLAAKPAAPDRQIMAELKKQKLLMAQLLGTAETEFEADKPKFAAPRPRSEKRFEQMIG